MENINELPVEIVTDILKRLRLSDQISCSLVCKQWHALISPGKYVKNRSTRPFRIHSNNFLHIQSSAQMFQNQPSFLNQRILDFSTLDFDIDYRQQYEYVAARVWDILPQLTHLSLHRNPMISDCHDMVELLKECKKVKSLRFGYPDSDKELLPLIESDISQHLGHVTTLEVNYKFDCDTHFIAFMKNFPNISRLTVNCRDDEAIKADTILALLIQRRQKIKRLTVHTLPKVTASFISALGDLPGLELEELDLICRCAVRYRPGRCSVDEKAITHLLNNQRKLKSLRLNFSCRKHEFCEPILQSARNLQLKDLQVINTGQHPSLADHLSNMPCLESLQIGPEFELNGPITGPITKSLKKVNFSFATSTETSMLSIFQTFRELRVVKLYGENSVTDLVLQTLMNNAPLLEELGLYDCRDITTEGFKELNRAKRLVKLTFENDTIDNDNLALLKFRDLRMVDLKYCAEVSDKGLSALVKNNRLIESISLTMTFIDDEFVDAICENLQRLSYLSYPMRLSDEALSKLRKTFKDLIIPG